jgi:hypothetical protein
MAEIRPLGQHYFATFHNQPLCNVHLVHSGQRLCPAVSLALLKKALSGLKTGKR